MKRGGERQGWLWAAAGIMLAAGVAYLPWWSNPFHFDDRLSILENAAIRTVGQSLGGMLRLGGRSLTMLSYSLTHAVSGQDPRGYHLADWLLHLAVSAGVGWIAFAMVRLSPGLAPGGASAVGAAAFGCFALHPLNSETVFYMSSRTDLLAGLVGLGSAWALLKAADVALGAAPGMRLRRAAGWGILSGALACLAYTAKETGLMGWFLGLLLAGWRCFEVRSRRLVWLILCAVSVLGLAALFPVFVGMHHMTVMQQLLGGSQEPYMDYPEHVGVQVRIHAWYLLPRLLFPFRLCLSPGPPDLPASWPGAGVLAVLVLQAGTAAAVWGWWLGGVPRLAALAWTWWFVGQAPTTLIALSDPVSEHRCYLAMAGPALLGGWLLARVGRACVRIGGWGLAAAALAGLAGLAASRIHTRGADFRSEESLWREVVRDAPAKPGARLNLGQAYDSEDRDGARAVRQYARALPRASPGFQAMIVNNIGNLQIQQGRFDEAVRTHEIALKLNPGNDDIRMNRAIAMLGAGRLEEGERELRALVAVHPGNGAMHRAFSKALAQRGKLEEAGIQLREAIAVEPDLVGAYVDLGMLELERKDKAAAVAALEEGVRRCGHVETAWEALGFVRYAAGDLAGAEEASRKALDMDPRAMRPYITLGAILEKRGDLDGAIAAYRDALKANPGNPMLITSVAVLEERRRMKP